MISPMLELRNMLIVYKNELQCASSAAELDLVPGLITQISLPHPFLLLGRGVPHGCRGFEAQSSLFSLPMCRVIPKVQSGQLNRSLTIAASKEMLAKPCIK